MKSKVLFILHLAPPVHGASMVGSYIKGSTLIKETFETDFINLSTANSLFDIGKTSFNKLVCILKLYFQITAYLVKHKVDLCYLTINASGAAWFKELVIVVILKSFHVPIIYHYHNKGVRKNANSFLKKQLYKFQFAKTKSILLSSLLENDISQFVAEKDIFTCPNGIPNSSYLIHENKPVGICQILFLSNLIESKGVYVLLDACQILKFKNIPFRSIYVGGEGDITAIQFRDKVRQMGLENHVYYQGKKYGIEKEIAFSEADIFAFPTFYHNECFPIVNLEAMQFALPIISTLEGAVPEVILDGVNGYLVPQSNIEILAEKLEVLILNSELRNEMGRAGKKMFEEKFTLEIFEKRIVEILQIVLKNNLDVCT
jgi:glycosyltransferase involved in cell wall biosynthesis